MFATYLYSKKSHKYFLRHIISYFRESTLNRLQASSLFHKYLKDIFISKKKYNICLFTGINLNVKEFSAS